MNPSPRTDEALFSDALARPASERAAFLDGACGGDVALRARLDALLAAHEGPESVMTSSPVTRAAPLPEEKPGDRIGRYKLLQQIGEGGCGVVYMAEQEEPVRRRVALKIIKLGMDTKAVVARFEAERQALAMMDHPNIAKVHDAGATATGRLFFVMELVRGVPITKYCDEGQLTPTARLELFIKVCQAIQHAHQKGIIHRDIKPSNILVTVNDGVPTPKVIDFGIAKATQGRLTDATVFTAFEQFIGTPVYMSPEQAEISSVDIDTRSDIYSLGVLLYELLTGRPPFDPKVFAKAGVDQIRQQIREVEPQTPSRRLHTISDEERTTIARLRGTAPAQLSLMLRGDLDWIVMRCLEKDRTRRYDTANGLAADIQRFLRDEPVTARPPSTAYLLQKLIRRNRVAAIGCVIVASVLVVGAVVSTWQAVRATRAEREQSRLRVEADRARIESDQSRERAVAAEQAERSGRQRAEAAEAAAQQSAAGARQSEQLAATARNSAENLLSYVFTDLGEELSDFGQLPLLAQLTEKAVAYYESLPAGLQTRDTRARHALAIAGIGALTGLLTSSSLGESRFGEPVARWRLEGAIKMFEELESGGPLTPFMRLSFASVTAAMANQYYREGKMGDSVRTLEHTIRTLEPALTDKEWGQWARQGLIKALTVKGSTLSWQSAAGARASLSDFARALALAEKMDPGTPPTLRSDVSAANVKAWYAEALMFADRRVESRTMNARASRELRTLVDRAPFLATAQVGLAWTARTTRFLARAEWNFAELRLAIEQEQNVRAPLLKLEPKNWAYATMLARSWAGDAASRQTYDWLHGDFAAAEVASQRALELWNVDWIPVGSLYLVQRGFYFWARTCAATGCDQLADRHLAAADAMRDRIFDKQAWLTPFDRLIVSVDHENRRRAVEFQRLNWSTLRANAQQMLDRLSAFETEIDGQRNSIRARQRDAHADLMRAALGLGDHATARREFDAWAPDIRPPAPNDSIQQRFVRLGTVLTRIDVVARAGERDPARAALAEAWTEVDAVFAAGPDYLFNQVQTARALSIRAEVAPLDATAKRELLERAAGYLRPAAAAGRLTRYECEVLLAGIEKQLTQLANTDKP